MFQCPQLSLKGMYDYRPDLFDNCTFPDGVSRETVLNSLLLDSAELEVLYPEPDFLKNALGVFCTAQLQVWQHLVETTLYEYDPIYNYDRREETSIQGSSSGENSGTVNGSITKNDKLERNLTNDVSINHSLNTSEELTHDTTDTDTETRNLAGKVDETRNLSGEQNRSVDMKTTNNRTPNLSQTISGTDQTIDSNNDTTTTSRAAFNQAQGLVDSEVQKLAYGKSQNLTTNRTEKQTGTDNTNGTNSGTDNTSTTDTGTVKTTTSDSGTVTHKITHTGRDNTSGSESGERTEKGVSGGSETTTGNEKTEQKEQGTHSEQNQQKITTRAYGNIGVTTTQQLIAAERELALFNVVTFIVNDIINKFCILVY